jgi:hypothetical protein
LRKLKNQGGRRVKELHGGESEKHFYGVARFYDVAVERRSRERKLKLLPLDNEGRGEGGGRRRATLLADVTSRGRGRQRSRGRHEKFGPINLPALPAIKSDRDIDLLFGADDSAQGGWRDAAGILFSPPAAGRQTSQSPRKHTRGLSLIL